MNTTPHAIDIRSLRVDYGDFIAVNDLTLTVPPGEVFGLVGPNGAGKTSTFRVLTTLMEPTYGEVILDGVDVLEDLESARRIIGYMPDLAPVPSDLKVGEFLEFHANAYGLGNRSQRLERVAQCLKKVLGQPGMLNRFNPELADPRATLSSRCELFGCDFILDADANPYLLEVNTNPALDNELGPTFFHRLLDCVFRHAFRMSVVDDFFENICDLK